MRDRLLGALVGVLVIGAWACVVALMWRAWGGPVACVVGYGVLVALVSRWCE